jgi:hypothetical protein
VKKGNRHWWAIVIALLAGAVALTGMISVGGSSSDRATFKPIIRDVAVLAESVHARAVQQQKQGTLAQNRAMLQAQGTAEMNRLFTPDLASRLTDTWENRNLDPAGSDLVGYGVTKMDFKSISVDNPTAVVTADVHKYLIESIQKDGKPFHRRLDGVTRYKLTLVESGGSWKVSEWEKTPDLGASKITLTPAE